MRWDPLEPQDRAVARGDMEFVGVVEGEVVMSLVVVVVVKVAETGDAK